MTIKIYNNSNRSLYPVFETGPGPVDQWMQAFFQLSATQTEDACHAFPRAFAYRLYVDPEGAGIPPNGSVTITLPLFTQLVPTIDPTQHDQFIDWWQGGRVYLFTSPYVQGDACPPPTLTQDRLADQSHPITATANPPACVGCTQPLEIYKSCVGDACGSPSLPVNDPSQIVEYSLGAIPTTNLPPPQPKYYLQTNNVDFDISYVNFAFLPGLVESFIDPPDEASIRGASNYPGYYGSPKAISTVQRDIAKFLGLTGSSPYEGWPQFVSPPTDVEACLLPPQNTDLIKVPAPLQVFASMECVACNTPESRDKFVLPSGIYTAPPCPPTKVAVGDQDYDLLAGECLWEPIGTLVDLWQGCTANTTDQSPTCTDIRTVYDLFLNNYASYTAHYADLVDGRHPCNQDVDPIPMNLSTLLGHVYGWTPFNDGCPAQWNTLEGGHAEFPQFPPNPDYPNQKRTFDRLNKGEQLPLDDAHPLFNPYVQLVHDASYMDATNVYSYSVDDALGNFQGEGTGLIIAMGGTRGLPNPNAATSPVYFGFGGGELDPVHFTNYSVCNESLNHQIDYRFDSVLNIWNSNTKDIENCPIALGDNLFNRYALTILKGPPYPPARLDSNNHPTIFACGVPSLTPRPDCYNYVDPKTGKAVQFIDCSANAPSSDGASWCNDITVHTDTDYNLKQQNYVTAGAPREPDPNGPDYSKDFVMILGDSKSQNRPRWKDFAVCQDANFTPIPTPTSGVPDTPRVIVDTIANGVSPANPCTITVRDASDRRYQVVVREAVPWTQANVDSVVDCTNVSDPGWCKGIHVDSNVDPNPLFNRFQLLAPPPDALGKRPR